MILYLHGFASAGEGGKYLLLKDAFPGYDVRSPTLPVDPVEAMDFAQGLLRGAPEPNVVIGTSLGGFYAWYLAGRLKIPAFLINPSMRPWEGLADAVGTVERFDSDGQTFEWTRRHVHNLRTLATKLEEVPGALLHFRLATDDEVLDHNRLPEQFPKAASMKWYDDCGHRFRRFAELIPDIQAVAQTRDSVRWPGGKR